MFTLAGVNHLLNFVERALAIPPVWVGDEVAGAIVEVDGGQSLLQRLSTPYYDGQPIRDKTRGVHSHWCHHGGRQTRP